MRKIIFFLYLALSVSTLSAQKVFIGQTKKQVKDFYVKLVGSDNVDEGKYDDTKEDWVMVIAPEETEPIFSATFDKAGKCKDHQMKGHHQQLERWLRALNGDKSLKYDNKKEAWVNSAKRYQWKIKNVANDWFELSCEKI
jgi:hypothetical protein